MRASYGPRMRFFNGIANDYKINDLYLPLNFTNKKMVEVDQFEFVEKSFERDSYTRQAIISMGDPAKDCFSDPHQLKETTDFPCTANIQFLRNGKQVDMIVNMRSNDFFWGASGVNIFNFTFMQEYFAKILGLRVGFYYHIVNNLHYYDEFRNKLEVLASTDDFKDEAYPYRMSFSNLREFDERIIALINYEKRLRESGKNEVLDFGDDFFNDWGKVFYSYNNNNSNLSFLNPSLNLVAKRKLNKKPISRNYN
jgi:thymidylate synthase